VRHLSAATDHYLDEGIATERGRSVVRQHHAGNYVDDVEDRLARDTTDVVGSRAKPCSQHVDRNELEFRTCVFQQDCSHWSLRT